jgi:deazaflavin-dependent oxidoreductase (nitroreductase family)
MVSPAKEAPMLMQLATLAGVLFVGVAVIALVFLLGMRAKSPLVLRPLIRLQRAIINPRQMRSAGTPGAYAAVIRHRGRTSGRAYETPVGAVVADDGFVIALPYGSRANWLQNVLASGSATLVHEGHSYQVDRPEIVPMQAVGARFTAGDQRSFRWMAVDQALRVRRIEPEGAGERFNGAARGEGARGPAIDPSRSMGPGMSHCGPETAQPHP